MEDEEAAQVTSMETGEYSQKTADEEPPMDTRRHVTPGDVAEAGTSQEGQRKVKKRTHSRERTDESRKCKGSPVRKTKTKKPRVVRDVQLRKPSKWKVQLRERASTMVTPIPMPQISGHKAKSTSTRDDDEKQVVVKDTPLKSWVVGHTKIQQRWIDPKTRRYVTEGTPEAVKLDTQQQVTDRACEQYKKRTDAWRQQIDWRAVLLNEKALNEEEHRVPNTRYTQPSSESDSDSNPEYSFQGSPRESLSMRRRNWPSLHARGPPSPHPRIFRAPRGGYGTVLGSLL